MKTEAARSFYTLERRNTV